MNRFVDMSLPSLYKAVELMYSVKPEEKQLNKKECISLLSWNSNWVVIFDAECSRCHKKYPWNVFRIHSTLCALCHRKIYAKDDDGPNKFADFVQRMRRYGEKGEEIEEEDGIPEIPKLPPKKEKIYTRVEDIPLPSLRNLVRDAYKMYINDETENKLKQLTKVGCLHLLERNPVYSLYLSRRCKSCSRRRPYGIYYTKKQIGPKSSQDPAVQLQSHVSTTVSGRCPNCFHMGKDKEFNKLFRDYYDDLMANPLPEIEEDIDTLEVEPAVPEEESTPNPLELRKKIWAKFLEKFDKHDCPVCCEPVSFLNFADYHVENKHYIVCNQCHMNLASQNTMAHLTLLGRDWIVMDK